MSSAIEECSESIILPLNVLRSKTFAFARMGLAQSRAMFIISHDIKLELLAHKTSRLESRLRCTCQHELLPFYFVKFKLFDVREYGSPGYLQRMIS